MAFDGPWAPVTMLLVESGDSLNYLNRFRKSRLAGGISMKNKDTISLFLTTSDSPNNLCTNCEWVQDGCKFPGNELHFQK